MDQIENALYEFKNEFEQIYNDMLETKAQKDEINNKLNVQIKKQYDKIYVLINEEQTSNNSQIERIKSI